MTPRVSVIMPVHNAATYLAAAIQSVLSQSFDDFELLIMDDGSTDDSFDIASAFGDKRIRIERKENEGLPATLNRLIAAASSDRVFRADADDVCETDRLAEQVRFWDAHPDVGVLGSFVTDIDAGGNVLTQRRYPVSHDAIVRHLRVGNPLADPAAAFDRRLVAGAGGFRDFYAAQDYDMWTRLAAKTRFANLTVPLVRRRVHKMSMGGGQPERQAEAARRVRRAFWVTFSGEPIDPDRWSRDLKRILAEEREAVGDESIAAFVSARVVEANLAFGANRVDAGLRCLYELSAIGTPAVWRAAYPLARRIGFRGTWRMARRLFSKKFERAERDPLFSW